MSKKKRKTRSQKEALGQKGRKYSQVVGTENIVEEEAEEIKTTPQKAGVVNKSIPDWASSKIDKDLRAILLYIGVTLFIVFFVYLIFFESNLLNPTLEKFNISY